nr:AEC family transporter [Aeromicrobium senzhongii]
MDAGVRATPWSFVQAGLRNPVSVAAVIGVLLSLAHVEMPRIVAEPISLLGAMAIPSALLAYGVALRFGPRVGHGNGREVAFVSVLKLAWQPLVAYLVARYALDLSAHETAGVTLMAALPTAQNVFVYASRFGHATVLARDCVAVTTVASLPVLVVLAAVLVP